MNDIALNAREVLATIVQEYILTGEPVSSSVVVRKARIDRSAATVRNIMADLESRGLLHQPHTSAGRLPTELGLRFYVDRLMKIRTLNDAEKSEIRSRYNVSNVELQQMLRDISHLLADMSKQCALVLVPSSDAAQINRVEFVPMRQGKMIVVLLLSNGRVENRLIELKDEIDAEKLAQVHAYLNDLCSGKPLSTVRDLVRQQLNDDQTRYDDLAQSALEVGASLFGQALSEDLLIEGQSRLLDHPELTDRDEIKALLHAIEEKRLVLRLLNETISQEHGVKIFIGSETQEEDFKRCAVVTAAYGSGEMVGTLGVVGPSNMNYPFVIPVVTFAADIVTEILRRY